MEKRKYKRLHYEDRQTIEAMSKQGSSVKDIQAIRTAAENRHILHESAENRNRVRV